MTRKRTLMTFVLLSSCALAGCTMTPHKAPPTIPTPQSFAEAPAGWTTAAPADAGPKGDWWTLFNDPVLNDLEGRVAKANQTVAAAVATYDQARAVVREQRATLLPSVTASGSVTDSRTSSLPTTHSASATIGATWEVDLFGGLRAGLSQDKYLAKASAGDLGNAILAAQGELALNYVQLRAVDAQRVTVAATIAAYTRALQITENNYKVGVSAKLDVLQAQTQLHNAQSSADDLERQRAILNHAIAVLVGENPSLFNIAPADWKPTVPEVPPILPSQLLERRPDVAAAERRVQAANAGVGVQRSAFFPTLNLSASAGETAGGLASLISSPTSLWSLGASVAETLFDFGGRLAKVAQAKAAYAQTVAQYKQTALTAFQQTEDELVAARIYAQEENELRGASASADRAEAITFNQYKAGMVSYANVITAQTTALTAREAAITATSNRQQAAVSLIQAIGGGWEP